METKLKFGVIGCGFWSQFQIGAWLDAGGVELVALWNRTTSKAHGVAKKFNLPDSVVCDSIEAFFSIPMDFVDIITDVDTHKKFTLLAATKGVNVICQKPLAANLSDCEAMVSSCAKANVRLFVHDNWRFQHPIRALKRELDKNNIGTPFRARVTYQSSFPVFDNQPFLRELEHFILMDMGSHILDVVRFLFGNVKEVFCMTTSVTPGIKGEDVATLQMKTNSGMHIHTTLSYASPVELDRFPEVFILVEGSEGSVELSHDYYIRATKNKVTSLTRHPPPTYTWADPDYMLIHSSIHPTNIHFREALKGNISSPELTGEDYLNSMRLVFAAYESAKDNKVVSLS